MSKNRSNPLKDDHGFTLIEVLVVVLIIGILAAIAIPSFLSQKGKAVDASAKEVARTGYEAAETYSTDHSGGYGGMEPSLLHEYEPVLQVAAGKGNAYLSIAESSEAGRGFTVTAKSPNGDTFSYTKTGGGTITRTCQIAAGNPSTVCATGTW
jgi:type IV pilus assembly protein PilA